MREELDTGFKAIAEFGKAVIEPITMYGIVRAGIAEKVRACFGDLAVVQTTVDLFRRLAAERGMECERDSGTMGWDGERLHVVRFDRSVKDARLALAKAALAFAESLTLIPAESSVVLTEDNRSLFEDEDPSFLDTMYAAQGDGRLFYSDEFMLRQLAAEIAGVRGIWTQAAALPRMLAGRMPRDEYLDIVTKLLELHYRFTAVDIGSIFAQIERDGWSPSAAFELLTKQYFIPNVDVGVATGVIADVARQAWVSKPHVAAFVRVFAALFKTQRRLQSERAVEEFFASVRELLRARIRLGAYRRLLTRLLASSTHLTPAVDLIERFTADADRAIFLPLEKALEAALAESGVEKA